MAKNLTDIRSLARSYTEVAIQTLAAIAQNGKSEPAQVSAAQALLDRGWGKPAQPIDGDGEGGPIAIQAIVRKIVDPSGGSTNSTGV
jgi:hypothetical protein